MFDHPMINFFQIFSRQAEAQISFFSDLSKNMIDSTQRLGNINLDVARQLWESPGKLSAPFLGSSGGTAADQTTSAAINDMQSFQHGMEEVAEKTRAGLDEARESQEQLADRGPSAHAEVHQPPHAETTHSHEVHEPSPLVEKMIASVVDPAGKPRRKR